MQTLQGIAVSPGVAIGEALVLDNEGFRIPRRYVARDAVEAELHRLNQAVEAVADEIECHRAGISSELGEQYGAIFSAHAQMLRDAKLRDELERLIREQHYSPEYAVSQTLRRYAKFFQELDSHYLAERAADIFDIEKNLLRNLLGREREELSDLQSPVIILAQDLSPSETASLSRELVLGFATEAGGASGHTAIVAKGMELPAVVGIGRFLADISGGDLLIIDGDHGRVIVQPDDQTLAHYHEERAEHQSFVARLSNLSSVDAVTTDGQRVQVLANIEFPHEVETCRQRGTDGIGLYRTEFLYLGADGEPSEADHYNAYAHVVRKMADRPTVIRTLDLGADKMGLSPNAEYERNPFLGLRSIRLSLNNVALFRTQLRAVLRASSLGAVHVLFPLITTLQELRRAKKELADAMAELKEEEVDYDADIRIGIMVETPASVLMLDRFVKEVDFISIGTNDLVQYTLAVDRCNSQVASLFQETDPAVLRLLKQSIEVARSAGIPATVCGQMSATMAYVPLLLGLGLRQISVPPSSVLEAKGVCRSIDISTCEAMARKALEMDDACEIDEYLHQQFKVISPELLAT